MTLRPFTFAWTSPSVYPKGHHHQLLVQPRHGQRKVMGAGLTSEAEGVAGVASLTRLPRLSLKSRFHEATWMRWQRRDPRLILLGSMAAREVGEREDAS